MDRYDRTADGRPITEGMIAFNNNLDPVRVGKPRYTERNENTGRDVVWYQCWNPITGQASAAMDGGRLSTTFRNWDGATLHAREVLIERYVELMDDGHDFGWDLDPTPLETPGCGACDAPALWKHRNRSVSLTRDHAEGCAYLAAQDRQEARA